VIRLVTLADSRFALRAANLARSVQNSTANHSLTIFCEDEQCFAHLRSPRCNLIELPEIARLGAKRAKLTAFAQAVREGDMIFLDADAIVLESLADMWGGNVIRGCADYLEYCSFIPDKTHPWPSHATLTNKRYINSGGFFAPSSQFEFFEHLRRESLDDVKWGRYTIEDCLYDNHFLCAYLNLCDTPVDFLDPLVYGWRGFLKGGELQVRRFGSQLVNASTAKPLAVILFAGVQQSPEVLRSLPPAVASLIFERIEANRITRDEAFAGIYAAASPVFGASIPDAAAQDVLGVIVKELPALIENCENARPLAKRSSYFASAEAVKAAAFANPSTGCSWNGFQCGGAYIDAEEYQFLRRIVRALQVRSVVETGAGETSVFFRNLGVKALSIEYQAGPWLERAALHGCDCVHVPFDVKTGMYCEPQLGQCVRSRGITDVDLLLIDSPTGTRNREKVLTQLLSHIRPRFVAYHDAFRDSTNIFRDQFNHSLRLVGLAESKRGLAVFAHPSASNVVLTDRLDPATSVTGARVVLKACGPPPGIIHPGQDMPLRLTLQNAGTIPLSTRYDRPILASYHWLTANGEIALWDGERTALPCDLDPEDQVEFDVDVIAPPHEGHYRFQPAVVQEGVCWLEADTAAAEFVTRVSVRR